MKATDVIRSSLDTAKTYAMGLILDMKDAPTASACPGGNHSVWVLGHLLHAEKGMVSGFILGERPQPGSDDALFGMGSKPLADASKYPSIEKLAAEYEHVRAHTLEVLASMTDADLDRPSHAPDHLKGFFGTVGQCFSTIASHQMFHAGEVADARKAMGRKPLFA